MNSNKSVGWGIAVLIIIAFGVGMWWVLFKTFPPVEDYVWPDDATSTYPADEFDAQEVTPCPTGIYLEDGDCKA